MKRGVKITLGVVAAVVVIAVLLYIFVFSPRTVTVNVVFPSAAVDNPTLKVASSIDEKELSKNSPSVDLKVKRTGDEVELKTLDDEVLNDKEAVRGEDRLTFEIPTPQISAFEYELKQNGRVVEFNWNIDYPPYEISEVNLQRNGVVIFNDGQQYTDELEQFQNEKLTYQLLVEYNYGPVVIERESDVKSIKVGTLPVNVNISVDLGEGLSTEKVLVAIDDATKTLLETSEVTFEEISQGSHEIVLSYSNLTILEKSMSLDWNDGNPHVFDFVIPSLKLSDFSLEIVDEGYHIQWETIIPENIDRDKVSYRILFDDEELDISQSEVIIPLFVEDKEISVIPFYEEIEFGDYNSIELRGKPRLSLINVPEYVDSTDIQIEIETYNIVDLKYILDGNIEELSKDATMISFKDLEQGEHELVIKGTGVYGRSLEEKASFIVDTIPPNEPLLESAELKDGEIHINFETVKDLARLKGKITVSEQQTIPFDIESSNLVIPLPDEDTGFRGKLGIDVIAYDFAENKSQETHFDVEVIDFGKIKDGIELSFEQKDYEEVSLFVKSEYITEDATLNVIATTPKGTYEFQYPLVEKFSIKEALKDTYFGKIKLEYFIDIAGIRSETITATETDIRLTQLKGFHVYQTDEDGKFSVEFMQLPDEDVTYKVRRKIKGANLYQAMKQLEYQKPERAGQQVILIAEFESPFTDTEQASMSVYVEIEIIGEGYNFKIIKDNVPLYQGATILTGDKTEEFIYDSNAFPILISRELNIEEEAVLSLNGEGLILLQDGASIVVDGELELKGNYNGICFESLSNYSPSFYEGSKLEAVNVTFTGKNGRLSGNNSAFLLEDCSFSDSVIPLVMKNGSSLEMKEVKFNNVRTAAYLSKMARLSTWDIEITNSTNGFTILDSQGNINIKGYKALDSISSSGLSIKNASGEVELVDMNVSTMNTGIEILNCSEVSVADSEINGSQFGLRISDVFNAMVIDTLISGDTFTGNPYIGILIANSGATIKNCEIENAVENGVFISNRTLPVELKNEYYNMTPLEQSEWSPVIIDNVNFSNNKKYDIFVDGSYDVHIVNMDLSGLRYVDFSNNQMWTDGFRYYPRGEIVVK
ncbi:MAG: right-handed parallel beta-helix repeat-containing protein, partial [Petrotogales bacterium]